MLMAIFPQLTSGRPLTLIKFQRLYVLAIDQTSVLSTMTDGLAYLSQVYS